ncbi:hypothetical protein CLOSTMETH_03526 [[Clostridium] methylpentosum DSM 5476]|uniref:Uncharacterized protein n=1 Tax=[Clostridium] methylpentosum DSM 5476 TaxID=537013 RepID=C0EI31_9FIRM|nr:hypothetical protein CLOSTMETH_03526 [[Clostridium] methylpentosum DSM 5476]
MIPRSISTREQAAGTTSKNQAAITAAWEKHSYLHRLEMLCR